MLHVIHAARKAAFVLAVVFSGSACAAEAGTAITVDLNTADVVTIDNGLIGFGPAKAQAVVDYRSQHGLFANLQAVELVPGIGPKLIERNKERIILTQPTPATPVQ